MYSLRFVRKIICAVLVTTMLLSSLALSSCSDPKKDNPLLGTWITTDTGKITFNEDGTCFVSNTRDSLRNNLLMDYEIDGDLLKVTEIVFGTPSVHIYTFNISDGVLYMTSNDDYKLITYYRSTEDFLNSIESVSEDVVKADVNKKFLLQFTSISNPQENMDLSYDDIKLDKDGNTQQMVSASFSYEVDGLISGTIHATAYYQYSFKLGAWEKNDVAITSRNLKNISSYSSTTKYDYGDIVIAMTDVRWLPSAIGTYRYYDNFKHREYLLVINSDYSVDFTIEQGYFDHEINTYHLDNIQSATDEIVNEYGYFYALNIGGFNISINGRENNIVVTQPGELIGPYYLEKE